MATRVSEAEALGQVERPQHSAEVTTTAHVAGSLGPGSAETEAEFRARTREAVRSGSAYQTAAHMGATQLAAPVTLGPNQLDGPRIAAREAQYGNRQAEMEAVMAMDEAAFDRVRGVESHMIARAEALVDDVARQGNSAAGVRPGLIESTENIVSELNDLVTALERGTPASQLADRFKGSSQLAV